MRMEQIEEEFKGALKAKDTIKVETLRMLKAAASNYLIEKKKKTLDGDELMSLIQKQVKLRQDAIEGYQKGGRKDLVDKEQLEKTFLEGYLPKPLSETELRTLIQTVIQKTGAKTKADIGRVMKEAITQTKGRAEARRINELAASLLT